MSPVAFPSTLPPIILANSSLCAEHDSDKRIQRDDEYSDSEDEGDDHRRNRESHRQKSPSNPLLASTTASASAPTLAPVETDTVPLPSNVTCGAEEPLPPRSTNLPPTVVPPPPTTNEEDDKKEQVETEEGEKKQPQQGTGIEKTESAPLEAALTETAPQAEIAAGEIAQVGGGGEEEDTDMKEVVELANGGNGGEGPVGGEIEMPVQGISADRMTAQ